MTARARPTFLALPCVAFALAGCATSRQLPDDVIPCPALVVMDGAGGPVTYGALIGSSERFVPNSCVAVYLDDTRIAKAEISDDSSFALRFRAAGDLRGRRLELRFAELDGRQDPQPYAVTLPQRRAADISYEEGALPLLWTPGEPTVEGTTTFEGMLAAPPVMENPAPSPISEVWIASWSDGEVDVVEPTPELDVSFAASMPGMHFLAPISRHESADETGGCWWPWSDFPLVWYGVAGAPCTGGRGCTPINVDERSSGAPGPTLDHAIRVGRPPDAGTPDDAGVDADAGLDAGRREAGVPF